MVVIDKKIQSGREALTFVRECEEDFDLRLSQLVHRVVENDTTRCITLSGPTCAGKTTADRKSVV